MKTQPSYYVIAPIDGIHMDFDYHMFSAELYGCPPNYHPYPDACPQFREPYNLLSKIPFTGYGKLVPEMISDQATIDVLQNLPDRRLSDYTCIGFDNNSDSSFDFLSAEIFLDENGFKQVVERGETFLDPLRLSIFQPGKNESAGRFGSIGNGIQCFWIGNEQNIRFFARKSLRYGLIQPPIDVLESEFGPIYGNFVFRGLCSAVFREPSERDIFHNTILRAIRAFRESREIPSPEARFRQLAAIAEDLAKIQEGEKVRGAELRDRISKIASNGWSLYEQYNETLLGTSLLNRENSQLLRRRYKEIGWEDQEVAWKTVKDLWDNVRNPLSHSLDTFESLNRDANEDIANAERVVVTMINGWYAAYEVEELFKKPIHAILLDEK